MGQKGFGRGGGEQGNESGGGLRLTIHIPVDRQGQLDAGRAEAKITGNGELSRDLLHIIAAVQPQVARIIAGLTGASQTGEPADAAGSGPRGGEGFANRRPGDRPRGVLSGEEAAWKESAQPTEEELRAEYQERKLVQALMGLPAEQLQRLKTSYLERLENGQLPGSGLLIEEYRRSGFAGPAGRHFFRQFLAETLLPATPAAEAEFRSFSTAVDRFWRRERRGGGPAFMTAYYRKDVEEHIGPAEVAAEEAALVDRWINGLDEPEPGQGR